MVRCSVVVLACLGLASGCGPTPTGDGNPDSGGGPGNPDAGVGPGFADARTDIPDAAACLTENRVAEEATAPVDIIWVIDTSGSMDDEASAVQNALNDFSSFIDGQMVDYRVVLIASANEMNVPPPLGGGPRFRHVNVGVGSTDALEKIITTYPQWQDFLRPDALVHFVVVTDDESNISQGQFDSMLAGLTSPGFPNSYTFHSICSEETVIFTPPPPIPPIMGPCSGGLGAGGAADPGLTYIDMVANTGGVWKSICSSDWAPIFTAVAQAVAVTTSIPCTFDIPPPPMGETLDPNQVNVSYDPGSGSVVIPRVDNAGACSGQGWYYDNPTTPTQIVMCPATCNDFDSGTGSVDIQFGCATIVD